jgi:hypothetical protein
VPASFSRPSRAIQHPLALALRSLRVAPNAGEICGQGQDALALCFAVGEASEVPRRSPGRGPPYWKSQVLRRQVLEDEQDCGSRGDGAAEVA